MIPVCRGAFSFMRQLLKRHPGAPGAAAWHVLSSLVDAIAPSVEKIDAAYFVLEDMHGKVRTIMQYSWWPAVLSHPLCVSLLGFWHSAHLQLSLFTSQQVATSAVIRHGRLLT